MHLYGRNFYFGGRNKFAKRMLGRSGLSVSLSLAFERFHFTRMFAIHFPLVVIYSLYMCTDPTSLSLLLWTCGPGTSRPYLFGSDTFFRYLFGSGKYIKMSQQEQALVRVLFVENDLH
jgi:hypothetical protein